jgi:hypothetical protein
VNGVDVPALLSFASNLLAIFLVVSGVVFFKTDVWPWWIERDATERKRKDDRERLHVETEGLLASALSLVGEHLKQPIHIVVDEDHSKVV